MSQWRTDIITLFVILLIKYKQIQTLLFIITSEKNFLINYQYTIIFCMQNLYRNIKILHTKDNSLYQRNRRRRPDVFLRKGVLKIYSKFTGVHLCWSAISIKLQSNFTEIALRHGCSPVNLLHIFRTTFLKNTSGWLLLKATIVKIDFTLNLAIARLGSNFSTSLTNENESFVIYSVVVIGLSTYHRTLLLVDLPTADKIRLKVGSPSSRALQIWQIL